MASSFFESTMAYKHRNTRLFDFITPTAVAMWNLRWQVRGFLDVVPKATKQDLEGRFIVGADQTRFDLRRANLKRAAVERSWDEQLEEFAQTILFAAIALYEGWLDRTTKLFPAPKTRSQELSRPSRNVGGRTQNGVREAIDALTQNPSRVMTRTLVPPLRAAAKYSLPQIDALLICYRYFKECRNSLLHLGGIADQRLEDASAEIATLTPQDMGMKVMPENARLRSGEEVRLTLRGVVGLSDVLYRVVSTLDAELATTEEAERLFVARWRDDYGQRTLPSERARRERRISRMTRNLGLPEPVRVPELGGLLRDRRLIF